MIKEAVILDLTVDQPPSSELPEDVGGPVVVIDDTEAEKILLGEITDQKPDLKEKVDLRESQPGHSIVIKVEKSDKKVDKDSTESESDKGSCLGKSIKIFITLILISLAAAAGLWYFGFFPCNECGVPLCLAMITGQECKVAQENENQAQDIQPEPDSEHDSVHETVYVDDEDDSLAEFYEDNYLGGDYETETEYNQFAEDYTQQETGLGGNTDYNVMQLSEEDRMTGDEMHLMHGECQDCECEHHQEDQNADQDTDEPRQVLSGAGKCGRTAAGVALLGAATIPISFGLKNSGVNNDFTNVWDQLPGPKHVFGSSQKPITLTLGTTEDAAMEASVTDLSETVREMGEAAEDIRDIVIGNVEENVQGAIDAITGVPEEGAAIDGEAGEVDVTTVTTGEADEIDAIAGETAEVDVTSEVDATIGQTASGTILHGGSSEGLGEGVEEVVKEDLSMDELETLIGEKFPLAEHEISGTDGNQIPITLSTSKDFFTQQLVMTKQDPRIADTIDPMWPREQGEEGEEWMALLFQKIDNPENGVLSPSTTEEAAERIEHIFEGITIDGQDVAVDIPDDFFVLVWSMQKNPIIGFFMFVIALVLLRCSISCLWCFDEETAEGYRFGPTMMCQKSCEKCCLCFLSKAEDKQTPQ